MTDSVRWEDPPPVRQRRGLGIWDERLAPLRKRPNAWAIVHTCANRSSAGASVAQLRGRLASYHPEERWELTTRGPDMYARFLKTVDA